MGTGTRVEAFCDAVRSRDKRCVITGSKVHLAPLGDWTGFEAAHIFPLAYEQHWTQFDYGRWILIIPDKGGLINSVQNGLLLRSDIHQQFDTYAFAINPDVCIHTLYLFIANDYYRTTIRLLALEGIIPISILPANILINSFFKTPKDQLISFSGGTSDKLFLLI